MLANGYTMARASRYAKCKKTYTFSILSNLRYPIEHKNALHTEHIWEFLSSTLCWLGQYSLLCSLPPEYLWGCWRIGSTDPGYFLHVFSYSVWVGLWQGLLPSTGTWWFSGLVLLLGEWLAILEKIDINKEFDLLRICLPSEAAMRPAGGSLIPEIFGVQARGQVWPLTQFFQVFLEK